MDPVSITTGSLTLAKVALRIASVLHSGVQAVRGADATLKDFHGEVTTLANSLNLVGRMFQNPKLKNLDKKSLASDGQVSDALQSLRSILVDCEDTLSRLNSIVQNASSTSKKTIFRRGIIAVKLDFKSAEIISARNQIQTYGVAMQISFSVLNL